MTGFLLDVNVLVALMWPAHESHLLGLAIPWLGVGVGGPLAYQVGLALP
jgi:hypothetical protein